MCRATHESLQSLIQRRVQCKRQQTIEVGSGACHLPVHGVVLPQAGAELLYLNNRTKHQLRLAAHNRNEAAVDIGTCCCTRNHITTGSGDAYPVAWVAGLKVQRLAVLRRHTQLLHQRLCPPAGAVTDPGLIHVASFVLCRFVAMSSAMASKGCSHRKGLYVWRQLC